MTHPSSFEPRHPLDAVICVFWERGFAEASYEDLAEASGVGRKGLYAAFGNKETMFGFALRRYRQLFVASLLSDLRNPDIRLADIAHLLREIGGFLASKEGRIGCLMANTALDDVLKVPAVRLQVVEHLKFMSTTFAAALRRCGVTEEPSSRLSDYLTGTLQGLFVLGRAQAGRQMITNCTRTAIAAISLPMSSTGMGAGTEDPSGDPQQLLPGFEKFRSMTIQRRRFSEMVAKRI